MSASWFLLPIVYPQGGTQKYYAAYNYQKLIFWIKLSKCAYDDTYSIFQELCRPFALSCVLLRFDNGWYEPFPSGLLHRHWNNHMGASGLVKPLLTTERRKFPWCPLSSLVKPETVVMTTSTTTGDDKVDIMKIRGSSDITITRQNKAQQMCVYVLWGTVYLYDG